MLVWTAQRPRTERSSEECGVKKQALSTDGGGVQVRDVRGDSKNEKEGRREV